MVETEGTTATGTGARASEESVCGTIGKAFRMAASALGPPEAAAQHFRHARKEVLLGIRELIDARIEQLSRQASRRSSLDKKGTRIVVE